MKLLMLLLEKVESLYEDLNDEELECVKDYLESGNKLWIYEWERKGNGDEIFVIETDHPERYNEESKNFINREIINTLGFEVNGNGDNVRIEDVFKYVKE
ncbi:hypothetical protein QJ854_gp061 [Moumouvirus goulette]|uniref:Uncharacterized protein n=1 Tax=Moumouvirus goulette TaxID=1247379 RepID=M1PNV9_9VIRU|nr:hypothetical protein QJ854_gp061 [Moumouvirus goulette]AGF85721.1 hypothetical protein glt_00918 [Moumouvirus goulette]